MRPLLESRFTTIAQRDFEENVAEWLRHLDATGQTEIIEASGERTAVVLAPEHYSAYVEWLGLRAAALQEMADNALLTSEERAHASEALRRLLGEESGEELSPAELEEQHRAVLEGLADVEAGRVMDDETFDRRMRAWLAELKSR